MPKFYEGDLAANKLRLGFVVARFNELFTERLLEGGLDCFIRHGGVKEQAHVMRVPGGFEVPLAAKKLAEGGNYDAIVCLAAVVRGDTPHFDLVANEIAKGISRVALDTGIPVTFGVLTTNTLEQAIERSGTKSGNKGWEATLAAIEMANVLAALNNER